MRSRSGVIISLALCLVLSHFSASGEGLAPAWDVRLIGKQEDFEVLDVGAYGRAAVIAGRKDGRCGFWLVDTSGIEAIAWEGSPPPLATLSFAHEGDAYFPEPGRPLYATGQMIEDEKTPQEDMPYHVIEISNGKARLLKNELGADFVAADCVVSFPDSVWIDCQVGAKEQRLAYVKEGRLKPVLDDQKKPLPSRQYGFFFTRHPDGTIILAAETKPGDMSEDEYRPHKVVGQKLMPLDLPTPGNFQLAWSRTSCWFLEDAAVVVGCERAPLADKRAWIVKDGKAELIHTKNGDPVEDYLLELYCCDGKALLRTFPGEYRKFFMVNGATANPIVWKAADPPQSVIEANEDTPLLVNYYLDQKRYMLCRVGDKAITTIRFPDGKWVLQDHVCQQARCGDNVYAQAFSGDKYLWVWIEGDVARPVVLPGDIDPEEVELDFHPQSGTTFAMGGVKEGSKLAVAEVFGMLDGAEFRAITGPEGVFLSAFVCAQDVIYAYNVDENGTLLIYQVSKQ
ncbi:MAG: hypothetical protein IT462_03775 [Planctomycetes bacterium]|nr:hypothetical protein [Planctomycetota bacterium]